MKKFKFKFNHGAHQDAIELLDYIFTTPVGYSPKLKCIEVEEIVS